MAYYLSIAPRVGRRTGGNQKAARRDAAAADDAGLRRAAGELSAADVHSQARRVLAADRSRSSPTCCRCCPGLPADAPHNRLALARWLVDGKNPLTGRVTVNRLWQALFGRGLVRTTEDFGYQGELPTHPELLDWLAVELVNEHWSLKQMLRLIVTSATYQQSSSVTPDAGRARDPQNLLLARGPRFRLEAELIRDVTLRAQRTVVGKDRRTERLSAAAARRQLRRDLWTVGLENQHRRRPLSPRAVHVCQADGALRHDRGLRRPQRRSLHRPPRDLEHAAASPDAAQRRRGGRSGPGPGPGDRRSAGRRIGERAVLLFRRVADPAAQPITRCDLILAFLERQRARLASGELKGAEIAGTGEGDVPARAAWTLVARAILNLDEAVTKE